MPRLLADNHANRHTFLSDLTRVGVPLATALIRAHHSDPRLIANRFTHPGLDIQAAPVASLPPAPVVGSSTGSGEPDDDSTAALVAGNPLERAMRER